MRLLPAQRVFLYLISAFIFLPLLVVVLVSFSEGQYTLFPMKSFSLRWYGQMLSSGGWTKAALVSAAIAFAVATFTVSICLAAALGTARKAGRTSRIIEASALGPLLIPHAAVAMVLYWLVDSAGLKGAFLGIGFAHVIVVIPMAYRPIASALRYFDSSLPEAAMILGASPARVFWKVVLPNLRRPLISAFILTWMLSFDEVTVTAFLVGVDSLTLPVLILQASEDQPMPLLAAVSTVLILITALLTYLLQRFVGLNTIEGRTA